MKKLLIALLSLGVISTAEAIVYKMTDMTSAEAKKIDQINKQNGYKYEQIPFTTNRGLIWINSDSDFIGTLMNSKTGQCYDIQGEMPSFVESVKKVKCPAKFKSLKQINACVDKQIRAIKKEYGENAMITYDMQVDLEAQCQ